MAGVVVVVRGLGEQGRLTVKPHSSVIHLLNGLGGSVDRSVSLSLSLPPYYLLLAMALSRVLYVCSLI